MNFEKKKLFLINIAYFSIVIACAILIGRIALKYFMPFIIGGVIAFIVQKPAKYLSYKTKLNKKFCTAGLAVLLYLILLFILVISVYFIYKNSNEIIISIGDTFSLLSKNIKDFGDKISLNFDNNTRNTFNSVFSDSVLKLGDGIVSSITNTIKQAIKGLPSFLIVASVTVVASCYIAKDFNQIMRFIKDIIGDKKYQKILIIKNIVYENILKIIFGYLLIMVIVFFVLCIGFYILNINDFILMAMLVAFIDLLPVLGTGIVLLPWSIFSFFTDDIYRGVGLVVLYLLLSITKNIIEPRIIGKQIGINPLLSLVAIFLGYKTIGFLGVIIFPVVLIVVFEYYKSNIYE